MIVYITKYALTLGILEKEVKVSTVSSDMVCDNNNRLHYYHKPYWHENKQDAIGHPNKLKEIKIKSLEKQLSKIKKLAFE